MGGEVRDGWNREVVLSSHRVENHTSLGIENILHRKKKKKNHTSFELILETDRKPGLKLGSSFRLFNRNPLRI